MLPVYRAVPSFLLSLDEGGTIPTVTIAFTLTTPDTIVLMVCGLWGLRCAFKGFAWSLVRTIGLVGSLWAAGTFYEVVGDRIGEWIGFIPDAAAPLVAWVLILIVVFFVFSYLAHLARGLMKTAELTVPDRFFGFALGVVTGLVFCAAALVVWGHVAGEDEIKETMEGSMSARYMAEVVEVIDGFFPDSVRERFGKALKALDEAGEESAG